MTTSPLLTGARSATTVINRCRASKRRSACARMSSPAGSGWPSRSSGKNFPLLAEIKLIGGQTAELEEFDPPGRPGHVVVQHQGPILGFVGVPKVVLDLWISQPVEQAPPFRSQQRETRFTGEFRPDLDIVAFRVEKDILILEKNAAAAFGFVTFIHRACKAGECLLNFGLRVVGLDAVHRPIQDVDIEIGAFRLGLQLPESTG